MKTVYSDVLVIGGGLAGLRTAVGATRRGLDTLILSLVPAKRSHSVAAQGGMQASLGNSARGLGDNEDVHFADTVKGSDWGCDQTVARMFAHMAPKAVRELAAWGVPWSRVRAGSQDHVINGEHVSLSSPPGAQGLINARNFGGTAKWRTCYTSDGTGHSMLYALSDRAVAESIPVHERKEAIALIHSDGRCYGAVVRDLNSGELIAYLARATVIATGGYGRIYGISTNAIINEGIGHAIALETGCAPLANMEAVQFHPTAIVPAGILVTEGCRGDGGVLRDGNGDRFMLDYEPDKKELASRDVVSRCMAQHMRKGLGVDSAYGPHLWLDITQLGAAHIDRNLREVRDICRYFLGIDPAREWIPVRPTQHYSMGGIRTDYRGESPSLKGLFACGEAACWDLHGFNRLGGNSVAETVVAGMLVAEYVADFCDSPEGRSALPVSLARDFVQREETALGALLARRDGEAAAPLRQRMEAVMTEHVGLFRHQQGLSEALSELQDLYRRSRQLALRTRRRGANPELVQALRLPKMLRLAICVTQAALQRTESRGAHCREDFPERNDRDWLSRTLLTWPDEAATAPTIDYEPLAIQHMEIPPAFRGYGSKQVIDNPATAQRQAQLDALPEAADRYAEQQQRMPFLHLLPARYRGRNERLEDG